MKPSLIIGIGGSGMAIGHSLKYLFHSYLPEELNSNVRFLFFDNDKNEFNSRILRYVRSNKSLINYSEIIKLTSFNAFDIINELRKYERGEGKLKKEYEELYKWIDLTKHYPPGVYEEGLAGNRMIGRLCGYIYYNAIQPAISNAAADITKILPGGKANTDNLNIYIIASQCGGTGSSLFFDISALVDHAFNISSFIPKTFFMINPNYFLGHKRADGYMDDASEYKNLQINSMAFIEECEYFIDKFSMSPSEMGKFTAKRELFKSRVDSSTPLIPFSSGIVFDQISSTKGPIPKETFYESLANIIFYSLTSASDDEFRSHISVNKFREKKSHGLETVSYEIDQNQSYKYGCIGIKTIKFPKEEFTEYFIERYLYEIFDKVFLKENPSEKLIETRAAEFVSDLFSDDNSGINAFTLANSAFQNTLDEDQYASEAEFNKKYIVGKNTVFTKPDSEKLADLKILQATIAKHKVELESYKNRVNELFEKLQNTNYIGFKDSYKDRPNVADHLRRILGQRVYEIIRENGYYGVLGRYANNTKIKGFLQLVREQLIQYYQELKEDYNNNTVLISEKKFSEAADLLMKKSGKKVADADKELTDYINKYKSCRDSVVQNYKLRIMQKILFEFAVGDAERSFLEQSAYPEKLLGKTDLSRYEDDLSEKVGLSVRSADEQSRSLIREFDDGKENSNTIKNNFTVFLRNKFRDTEKDLFTYFLPFELTTLLDNSGWKKGSKIDRLFNDNIIINSDEIEKIFKEVEDHMKMRNIILLTKFEDNEEKKTIREVFSEIKDKVVAYCQGAYINNAKNPIGEFLHSDIVSAFEQANDKRREHMITTINDVVFPVYTSNLGKLPRVGPYININPALRGFVNKELSISNKIIENDNLETTKLVMVSYLGGINYEEIHGNSLNKYEYENRAMDLFKPFLDKSWNKKVRGPWGDTDKFTMNINVKGNDNPIEYIDALALLIGLDILAQKNNKLFNLLFVTDKNYLKNKNVVNRLPIHYNSQVKQYLYYRVVNINDKAVRGKEKLWIEDKGRKEIKLNLPLSLQIEKKMLWFQEAIKILRNDSGFRDVLSITSSIISTNYEEIKRLIKNDIDKIDTGFPKLRETIRRRNKANEHNHEDLEMAYEFDDRVKNILKLIFAL